MIPTRILAAGLAFFLGATAQAQEKERLYEGPKDAGIAPMMDAANALAARCEAYLLDGVKGTVTVDLQGRNVVKLTCPKGFPPEKTEAVDFLASFPAAHIRLRILHKLGTDEQAKYAPGGEPPEGAAWDRLFEWKRSVSPFESYLKSESDPYFLFRKQPLLDATGKVKVLRHDGKQLFHKQKLEAGTYLEFPKDLTQALHATLTKDPDKPAKELFLATILLDGVKLDTGGGAMRWYTSSAAKGKGPDVGVWSFKELSTSTLLDRLIEHPLPFPLKPAE
jgi:hypothetical protein